MAPSTLTALAEEKTLQASFVRDEDERPKVAYNHFSNEIPVISVAGIDDGGEKRGEICDKIVKACEEWGVFQIVDHGVDAKLVSEMTTLAKEFFALPPEEKLRFDMQQVVDARLASKRILFLHEDKARPKDYKFSWGMLENHLTVSIHGRPKTFILEERQFKAGREIVTFFSYPTRTERLFKVARQAGGMESDGSRNTDRRRWNLLASFSGPDLTLGLKRHTDPGTITLLLQDTVGGLQATRDNGKTWITVQPVDGAFVVNLGDHGHYLSNGRFKNADHQAVVNSNSSRLSIATFQNPAPDAIVYPLKIREGEKSVLDEPMTFAEMYRRKMSKDIEIAMKKKLAKEQLLKDLETPKLSLKRSC
ncbi:2-OXOGLUTARATE (2OG) AND FE(II)-DEPENDENT OXYGENASE SUPERFAMILY PROTEIN-RELATED [Salix purpurea]|uniref:2-OXOGLUTARATE (2OG) AND FE(II)-DEPENDENT OXYGENASE SUPERFAMILY PROTEIN-RELATED n=1 Tax=Salix purpurea TaxID=77065 RepID=A0A9Q1A059_SALPP|nr:2-OXOGLUTARATE (2OG) AND FE(II)-DEPENDENT OXYGENASE SUPERFAMILY PROTEIN-RELATED [Salix purpurea]